MKTVSILGCGWLGLPLGEYLAAQGYRVKGSTRQQEKLARITAAGMSAYQLEVTPEAVVGAGATDFFASEALVLNIPPGRRQPDVEERYPAQVRAVVNAAIAGGVKQVLLVSSTGVYPANNQWVTEETEVAPATASGRALVAAETVVQTAGVAATILRLAGLVGGERHPGRWFAGKTGLRGGAVPVNLVHREDCLAAIAAILAQEKWGEVYQLCADEHPLKRAYYPAMTKQLGLEAPVFDGEGEVPYKIIGNAKIKRDLGLALRYGNPFEMFITD